MKRKLLRSAAFVRAAKKHIKKRPDLADDLFSCLKLLEEDTFSSALKTHKLTGTLLGSWAASVGYDLRVIFRFVNYEGAEAVLLETMGTHDEVY